MDHDVVVRQKMTERYLLGELDSAARDEFEEHFFDCRDCALDVHAASLFVEQSKLALAEAAAPVSTVQPVSAAPVKAEWFAGLRSIMRPALVLPVMALLLAVVGYQNLVTYPDLERRLNSPQLLPWASVNVGTYGSEGPVVTTEPGKSFLLFVRIPPGGAYSHYTADLYNPAGKLEWSLTIPASSMQDQWPVQVPGTNREAGTYTLTARGVTSAGESRDIGRTSFELRILK
jgi:anti-sigma factor RsiW